MEEHTGKGVLGGGSLNFFISLFHLFSHLLDFYFHEVFVYLQLILVIGNMF